MKEKLQRKKKKRKGNENVNENESKSSKKADVLRASLTVEDTQTAAWQSKQGNRAAVDSRISAVVSKTTNAEQPK